MEAGGGIDAGRPALCSSSGQRGARCADNQQENPMLLIPNFVTLALYLIGCNGGLM